MTQDAQRAAEAWRRAGATLLHSIAKRLVAAPEVPLRRVIAFGSTVRGDFRRESDLDLLAIVEPRGRWGRDERKAHTKAVRKALGRLPFPVDVWVRTTDEFEEAREVPWGVEFSAAREGVVIASRPLDRTPMPRRTPDEVKRRNVLGLLHHAADLLARTDARSAGHGNLRAMSTDRDAVTARRASTRALSAVFVTRMINPPPKYAPLATWLEELQAVDPIAAAAVGPLLASDKITLDAARRTLAAVIAQLSADPLVGDGMNSVSARLHTGGQEVPQAGPGGSYATA